MMHNLVASFEDLATQHYISSTVLYCKNGVIVDVISNGYYNGLANDHYSYRFALSKYPSTQIAL